MPRTGQRTWCKPSGACTTAPPSRSPQNSAVLWANSRIQDFGTLGGTITNLNSRLSAGSGSFIFGAVGINDGGQIVGSGIFNGQERACVLNPAPQRSRQRLVPGRQTP